MSKRIEKLLTQILAEARLQSKETRKQTEVILAWQNQDRVYHDRTLKKMGKSAPK